VHCTRQEPAFALWLSEACHLGLKFNPIMYVLRNTQLKERWPFHILLRLGVRMSEKG
jgi:hypothetical protein